MTDFTIACATNSKGPLPTSPYGGNTGSGYYDGATNGFQASCGVSTPSTPTILATGDTVSCCGWSSAVGGQFVIALPTANLPQNRFGVVTLGAPANLTFDPANASLDTSSVAGYTLWLWNDSHEFTYVGDSIPVTFASGGTPVPTPSGKGQITNPWAWETVSSGKLPPTEYDGIPGNGQL